MSPVLIFLAFVPILGIQILYMDYCFFYLSAHFPSSLGADNQLFRNKN